MKEIVQWFLGQRTYEEAIFSEEGEQIHIPTLLSGIDDPLLATEFFTNETLQGLTGSEDDHLKWMTGRDWSVAQYIEGPNGAVVGELDRLGFYGVLYSKRTQM